MTLDKNQSKRAKTTTSVGMNHFLERPRVHRMLWPEHTRSPSFADRSPRPFLRRQQRNREVNSRFFVENWRKSIVGLVRLAEKNLAIAEDPRVEFGRDYRFAVEFAFTGVENISRALIHCYGGKPDPRFGQEEALKLLSTRFLGDEKNEFEKAIDSVTRLAHNKTVLGYASKHNIQIRPLDEAETKQLLKSASDIVSLFKRIITNHFATEIPELQNEAFLGRSSRARANE